MRSGNWQDPRWMHSHSHKVHDQDTKLDSQLLDNHQRATLFGFGNLGKIHGHLGRCDANREAVEHTSNNECARVLTGNLHRGAYQLEDAHSLDFSVFVSKCAGPCGKGSTVLVPVHVIRPSVEYLIIRNQASGHMSRYSGWRSDIC